MSFLGENMKQDGTEFDGVSYKPYSVYLLCIAEGRAKLSLSCRSGCPNSIHAVWLISNTVKFSTVLFIISPKNDIGLLLIFGKIVPYFS